MNHLIDYSNELSESEARFISSLSDKNTQDFLNERHPLLHSMVMREGDKLFYKGKLYSSISEDFENDFIAIENSSLDNYEKELGFGDNIS